MSAFPAVTKRTHSHTQESGRAAGQDDFLSSNTMFTRN